MLGSATSFPADPLQSLKEATPMILLHPVGRFVCVVLLVSCVVLLAAPAASAQDATIFGQVTDASGAILPGVTVTVSSPALLVKQLVDVTNATGEYRVTPLPLGTYSVEFTLAGFQTQRREAVRLTAGFASRIDVQLKVGAVQETVTVSGQSPVVDVRTTSAGTQVTREILESAPTARNGINSLVTLAAGTRAPLETGKLGASDPVLKAFGRGNNGWITVDGVSTTSPRINSAFKNDFSYSTLQEAQLTTVGSSAEAPNSGVQINLFIKSGGNEFHGEVPYAQTFDRNWMQANNIDDNLRSQGFLDPSRFFSRWDVGGDLGGRIVPDKLWFYGSVRRRREDVTNQGGPPYPDGSPSTAVMTQTYVVGKETLQLTPTQRFTEFTLYRRQPWQVGSAALHGPEEMRINFFRTLAWNGGWQMAKGNRLLSIGGGHYGMQFLVNPTLSNLSRWTDSTLRTSEGLDNSNGGSGVGRDAHRWEGKGTFTWYKPDWLVGNHEFKIGANYDSAADLRFTRDIGNCTPTGPIASFCDPTDVPGNYVLVYANGVPSQLQARNNPVSPQARLDYVAAYFQDSWVIHRRLTLNLGVRYSNDRGWLPAQCRDAAATFPTVYGARCWPEAHPINTFNQIVPRLHAAYDMSGDGKTVIKGGWGRFYNLHLQDELDIANPNSDISTTFRWHPATYLGPGRDHFRAGDAVLDLNGADFLSQQITGSAGNVAGLVNNPDLKNPGSDEFSLSMERELMANFSLRVTGVYAKEFNTLRLLNTLRPYDAYNIPVTITDPGPDGVLGTADDPGVARTFFDYPASLRGAAFQRPMYINDAKSDASYKSIEITGTKRMSNRWQLLAGYSATKKRIPVSAANGNAIGIAEYTPNAEINTSDNTWEWLTRVGGAYVFPYDVQVSANLQSISGDTWGRTLSVRGTQLGTFDLRVEPIGFRNTGTATTLALQAEKAIRLRSGQRVSVGLNVLNLLNANFITTASQSGVAPSGAANVIQASGRTFGRPNSMNSASIAFPRIGELVIRYSF